MRFNGECYFCDEPVRDIDEEGHHGAHVTFKSGHEGFLCEEHFEKAQQHDQLTEVRLVMTGMDRIIKRYDAAYGL